MKKRIIEITILFTIAIVVFVISMAGRNSNKTGTLNTTDVHAEDSSIESELKDSDSNGQTGKKTGENGSEQSEEDKKNEDQDREDKEGNFEEQICVYLCGAIKNPGVYYLPLESRINDAVILAGGMLQEADADGINLAEIISDGRKIRIPYQGEEVSDETYSYDETGMQGNGKVNINTASIEELTTIPGIGQTRANAIVEYRKKHGDFKSVEEIMNVSGIKEGLFSKISPYIKV